MAHFFLALIVYNVCVATTNYQDLLIRLNKNRDLNYNSFNRSIANTNLKSIGVRLPILQKISKELVLQHVDIASFPINEYYEVDMVIVLTNLYEKKSEILKYEFLDSFLEHVECWAICDSAALAFKSRDFTLAKLYIDKWFKSKAVFKRRFAYVLLLSSFVSEEHLNYIFQNIKFDDEYYVKMSIAWLISVCMVKNYDKSLKMLLKLKIDDWTFNKAIQKCLESYRLSDCQKEELKKLKRQKEHL